MPPDPTNLAQAGRIELGNQDSIEREPGQWVTRFARREARPRGRCPDLEELFRSHLVGDVPVGYAARRRSSEDLIRKMYVLLQLHPLPVLPNRFVPTLLGERCVVIGPVLG